MQGDHHRQRVGEVVDDVDLAQLDELVDAVVGVVLDDRRQPLDGRRGEQRLHDLAVLEELRRVHLDRDRLLVAFFLGGIRIVSADENVASSWATRLISS